jgi:hypothetical protein
MLHSEQVAHLLVSKGAEIAGENLSTTAAFG